MKPILFCTILFTFFALSASAQISNEGVIKQLNQQFLNALVQEDSASLADILDDEFILINPGGKRRTRADALNLHIPGQQVTEITIDSEDIRMLTGELGIITVWTTNYITAEKEKMVLKICYMDIYQKKNNKWRAVAAHVALLK
jgi:hypothetical protein